YKPPSGGLLNDGYLAINFL
ncbi:hypothetical protein A2U01_0076630, partial [Trifolium medium]|nr:hypothetical protein [Trifolium medium]